MLPQKQKGFTIVELLIVIVVIGILAAITIVAYNGVQNRARIAALTTDLSGAAKQLAVYEVDAGNYPATLSAVNNGQGIKASDGTTYQYTVSGSTYCLTGTKGTASYKVSNDATVPTAGGCAGHGVGGVAAITNYAPNPTAAGASVAAFGYAGTPVAATRSIASDQSHHGGTSLKTYITGASGQTGAMARPPANSLTVSTGEKLSWSFWTYSTKAGTLTVYIEGSKVSDGSYTGASAGTAAIPANTWTKVTGLYTAPLDMKPTQVGAYNLSVVANDTVWFDEFMIEKGDTLHNYADGNSANWVWNGNADNATSTGPPV
jgi:prepilin-type N-terminal cleavage/methylation domain-containing protein